MRRLTEFLDLDEAQTAALNTVLEQRRSAVAPLREEVRERRSGLKELLDGPLPDASTVGQEVIRIHELKGQIRRFHESFREQFFGLLNPEQQEKLKTARAARRGGVFRALRRLSDPDLE